MSDAPIFIAMNRFQVANGAEAAFEKLWRERPSHIAAEPGFLAFRLLRGPANESHTLYASHTVWQNRAAFEAWTKSEAFRAAHHGSGSSQTLIVGHPQFEGFEAVEGLAIDHAQ